MFIKRIEFKNNPILWDLKLDFTLDNWEPAETIILWWENWTWKTTILEAIFSLWNYYSMQLVENEERIFEIQLNKTELNILKKNGFLNDINQNSNLTLFLTFFSNQWFIYTKAAHTYPNSVFWSDSILTHNWTSKLFYPIYSDVGINYNSGSIQYVTTKDVDQNIWINYKSPPNLSQEIKQLLVDINTQDALDFSKKFRDNKDTIKNDFELLEKEEWKRMKRFNSAFSSIFPNKRFKEVRNGANSKEVIFEENGKECTIDQLSSWEKQIVFRWGFLLQNKNSINGNIVLIDEPEISLHPNWQLKILDFYKKIFQNESWQQTSQLIVVTHSPFIINNPNRLNDKVITLSKDNWKIIVDEEPKFFWFSTAEEFVSESFNLSLLTPIKPFLYVEDEYCQIYQIAYLKLNWVDFTKDNLESKFNENSSFAIHAAKWAGAVAWLLRMPNDTIFEGKTIIWLFDFDKEWREQFYYLSKEGFWKEQVDWGKEWEKVYWEKELWYYKKRNDNWDFYAMLLPIPERLSKYADITWKDFASYIEIEDLLSEAFLQSQGCLEKKSTPAWDKQFVKDDKKRYLWKALIDEPKETFLDFKPIFDRVEYLINLKK